MPARIDEKREKRRKREGTRGKGNKAKEQLNSKKKNHAEEKSEGGQV